MNGGAFHTIACGQLGNRLSGLSRRGDGQRWTTAFRISVYPPRMVHNGLEWAGVTGGTLRLGTEDDFRRSPLDTIRVT